MSTETQSESFWSDLDPPTYELSDETRFEAFWTAMGQSRYELPTEIKPELHKALKVSGFFQLESFWTRLQQCPLCPFAAELPDILRPETRFFLLAFDYFWNALQQSPYEFPDEMKQEFNKALEDAGFFDIPF